MKNDTIFFCTDCGHESGKWLGQCPGCGAWNSYAEQPATVRKKSTQPVTRRGADLVPISRADIDGAPRSLTGLDGLDRVLGGGLVAGSLLLVAGEPGVGKSTLLLQMAAALARADAPVVYVTAEESAAQVALRARRLDSVNPDLLLLAETSCEAVESHLEHLTPSLVVVDSVQTVMAEAADGVAGSVGQVRHVAARFQQLAKTRGVPVILVGHVTKEGVIAGPKLLEHLVDVVMALEGEPGHDLRVLRATKNRFGAVAEFALYSMTGRGLEAVLNPSAWLLEDRRSGAPGSAVAAALEGTAPLLVEVQALVSPSVLGTPRRVVHGFDGGRVALLLAVLERNSNIGFADKDVFVNLAGGLVLREPALDLAVAAAVVSSALDLAVPSDLAVFGEVGLLGEVRAVSRAADRVKEAAALGFKRVALPARDASDDLALPVVSISTIGDIEVLLRSEDPKLVDTR